MVLAMKLIPLDFSDYQSAYCSAWVATAIVGSAVIGGAVTAYSANKAASAQTDAANKASDTQLTLGRESNKLLADQYNQTREDLAPYRTAGSENLTELQKRLPFLTSPIEMTQENLEKTPGYDFTKTQGLKGVQNSAAARGLGVSGAALKGAATFATGLANQTYKDQFALENTNRQNAYDRLMGVIGTGENAAAITGTLGNKTATSQASVNTATGQGVAANTIGAGNAQAAAANATGAGVTKAFNDVGGYAAYKGLYGGSGSSPVSYVTGSAGDYAVPTFGR
jgi:hypothetical protein